MPRARTIQQERDIFEMEIRAQQAFNKVTCIHNLPAEELNTWLDRLRTIEKELRRLKGGIDA